MSAACYQKVEKKTSNDSCIHSSWAGTGTNKLIH